MTYPGNTHPLPPLVSVRLLEGKMGLDPGTLPNLQATAAIHGASGAVRDVCGWRLDREVVTNYKPAGSVSWLLDLPTKHLVSVERVEVDGVTWVPFTAIDGPTWDYSVSTATAQLKARRGWRYWPEEEGRIEVDFTHGWNLTYDDPPDESPGVYVPSGLPSGLESIILAVAERSLMQLVGLSSLKVGQITESFAGAGLPTVFIVSKAEADQLAPYRLGA